MSSSSSRATRTPLLMSKLPSRSGSLIKPFQPTVIGAQAVAHRLQALRIFDGGTRVMDRTRPDHNDHAVIHAVQDAVHALTGGEYGIGRLLRARELAHHMRGRMQVLDFSNTKVGGIV
ncbi:hypothetical protein G6F40_016981 [Rhizopus arrhizus]|nr:hypothetical protein G6F40_016981 [Rhizopus arrhizus]